MMKFLKTKINQIKEFLIPLSEKKYFFEVYSGLVCLISLLTWSVIPIFGMCLLGILVSFMFLLFNDIKYALPALMNFIFVNSNEFKADNASIGLFVTGAIFLMSLVYFIIKNRSNFRWGKMKWSFIIMIISGIIPIFWSELQNFKEYSYMYILYFNWVLYFIIYLLVVNTVRKNIIHEMAIALSYLGILIAFECFIETIRVLPERNGLFDVYYELGWGLCNEAGLMMTLIFPFVFYLIIKGDKKDVIINIFKLLIIFLGILVTTSRASYIIAVFEFGLCYLALIIFTKYRKTLIIGGISAILLVFGFLLIEQNILNEIKEKVFYLGIGFNGRELLYQRAMNHFLESPKTIIFGDGIVNEFEYFEDGGFYRMYVYHSTIFQTLATMGILGMLGLIYHFVLKYMIAFKKRSIFTVFLFISFIGIDLYGLIDNTYHMYYYMIILVIILGIKEISNESEV